MFLNCPVKRTEKAALMSQGFKFDCTAHKSTSTFIQYPWQNIFIKH